MLLHEAQSLMQVCKKHVAHKLLIQEIQRGICSTATCTTDESISSNQQCKEGPALGMLKGKT